jgi:hypothetical protein
MQLATSSHTFNAAAGSGPQQARETLSFSNPVSQAVAVLNGFEVAFSEHKDHHLGRLQVDVEVDGINGTSVTVIITYGLRDWSGSWDDGYDGTIRFSVIAE